MSSGEKWDRKKVEAIAHELITAIAPGCERCKYAGSIRRGNKLVGDVELVVISGKTIEKSNSLFAEEREVDALPPILDRLEDEGMLTAHLRGDKHRRYRFARVRRELYVDLFIVHPAGWGNQYAIRTGPAAFSHRMVTQRHRGGLLNDAYVVRDGFVWVHRPELPPPGDGTQPPAPYTLIDGAMFELYPCPEESDFMALLSCGYVEPKNRSRV